MATLYLHIGHNKTGTTFIQSLFLENRDRLRGLGIVYPHGGADEDGIDLTEMTPVGNARHLLKTPQTLAKGVRAAAAGAGQSVLFSSEILFKNLCDRDDLAFVPETAARLGFDRVKLLLLVRDPIPLAVSIWQQKVKGWAGETRPLERFIAESFDWPQRALRLLEELDRTPGIEVELHNHGALRGALKPMCERWLGLEPGTLAPPADAQANRSMTRAEAELQRLLNLHLGRASGALFAYPVISELTDVPRDPPVPDPEVARAWLDRSREVVAALEARLPEEEGFRPYVPLESPPPAELSFSPAQLEILARSIARRLPETAAKRKGSVLTRQERLRRWVRQLIRSRA
jgi:hypothetical protein